MSDRLESQMPRAEKSGPGWTHEFGGFSVERVVGALGVNRTGGGCGVKRNRVESGTKIQEMAEMSPGRRLSEAQGPSAHRPPAASPRNGPL